VFERLLIRNIVPQIQGWNFGSMKTARELLENLFDEEEEKRLQIKIAEDGKGVTWRTKDDDGNDIPQEKEIEITEGLSEKIAKFLKRLDRDEQLGFEHYSVYEKFIGD